MSLLPDIPSATHAVGFNSGRIIGRWSIAGYRMALLIISVHFLLCFNRMIPTSAYYIISFILFLKNRSTTAQENYKY